MAVNKEKYLPVIVFIALCFIWSSTWVVLKVGLWNLPPFLAAGIRFLLAFALLLAYAYAKKIPIAMGVRSHLFYISFGLINFTGGYALVYWGQQYIMSGMGSILFSVMPFYVLFFSIWLLPDDRISLRKLAGVVLGFLGVLIIFRDNLYLADFDLMVLLGMLAVVTAPAFSSLGTIMGKKARKTMHPIALNTMPMFYTALSFFVLSLIFERNSSPVFDFLAIFSLIYLAFLGTSVAFVLYFWMLKKNSAVMMSMITFITPPMALFWGWLLLDEPVTHFLLLGMAFILAGIFIVRR